MVSRPVKCPCLHCCDLCDNASMWTVLRPLFTRAPSWFPSLARRPSISFALIQEHPLGNHVVYQALAPTQPIIFRQARDLLCAGVAHQLTVDVLAGMAPGEAAFFLNAFRFLVPVEVPAPDFVQFQVIETMANELSNRLRYQPLAPERNANPVADLPPRCPGSPCRTARRSSALCFRWPCCLLSGKRRTSPARKTRCG